MSLSRTSNMAFETDLQVSFFEEKYLSMDEESIIYDDIQMMMAEITGFSYGAVVTRVHGIKANTHYHFRFRDSSGDDINIEFYKALIGGADKPEETYNSIIEYTWQYAGDRLLAETVNAISKGIPAEIGKCTLDRLGVHYESRPLFGSKKEQCIPWNMLTGEIADGQLYIQSSVQSDVWTRMDLRVVLNAHLLKAIIGMLQEDPSAAELLAGKKR